MSKKIFAVLACVVLLGLALTQFAPASAWDVQKSASADCKGISWWIKNTEHFRAMKVTVSDEFGHSTEFILAAGHSASGSFDQAGDKPAGKMKFSLKWLLLPGSDAVFANYGKVKDCNPPPPPPKKVYVCKYVGQPGIDERLQTGQNPIEVSENAIPQKPVVVGSYFADAQGRSFVLGFVPMDPEPTAADCPPGDTPPPPPVDLCPNIDGVQAEIPSGMIKDDAGNCVLLPEPTTEPTQEPTQAPTEPPVVKPTEPPPPPVKNRTYACDVPVPAQYVGMRYQIFFLEDAGGNPAHAEWDFGTTHKVVAKGDRGGAMFLLTQKWVEENWLPARNELRVGDYIVIFTVEVKDGVFVCATEAPAAPVVELPVPSTGR